MDEIFEYEEWPKSIKTKKVKPPEKKIGAYWYIYSPDHPRALGHYVKRATLVLEKALGRNLEKGELAHHIDNNKENDSLENLLLTTKKHHGSLHTKIYKEDVLVLRLHGTSWKAISKILKVSESTLWLKREEWGIGQVVE